MRFPRHREEQRAPAARRASAAADAQRRRRRGTMARQLDAVPGRTATRLRKWSRGSPSCSWRRPMREYVERLPAGAKGWLRGLTDPAVSKALRSSTSAMPRTSTSRGWRGKRACREPCSASVSASCWASRRCAIARAGGCGLRRHAARRQAEYRQHRLFGRLQQRGGVQPRVQARIWRPARNLAATERSRDGSRRDHATCRPPATPA